MKVLGLWISGDGDRREFKVEKNKRRNIRKKNTKGTSVSWRGRKPIKTTSILGRTF